MFDDIADCITQLVKKYPTFFNANAHHMRLNHTKKQLVNVFFIFRPLLYLYDCLGTLIFYAEARLAKSSFIARREKLLLRTRAFVIWATSIFRSRIGKFYKCIRVLPGFHDQIDLFIFLLLF